MRDRVRIGLMINRNRASFAEIEECLREITEIMPHTSGRGCRELRRIAREARWARAQIRIVGLLLRLIDKL